MSKHSRLLPAPVLYSALLATALGTATSAQRLITDVNRVARIDSSSKPGNFTRVGAGVFLTAFHPDSGVELYRTIGTRPTTVRVKDIHPGVASSEPHGLVNLNNVCVFAAGDAAGGIELWRSNGTDAGTYRIKDIRPGSRDSSPRDITVLGNSVYFVADDGTHGAELWKSDGTANGTVLVKDIRSGVEGSAPDHLVPFGGKLYFRADDGTSGSELWTSDGTTAGTQIVRDLYVGPPGSRPEQLTVAGTRLFFSAVNAVPQSGSELWVTDGTANGTRFVRDIRPGPTGASIDNMIARGNEVWFTADDGLAGNELWKSDGTSRGTTLVRDLESGQMGSYPSSLLTYGDKVYFSAWTSTTGRELFKSDGTVSGTEVVLDLMVRGGSAPTNLTVSNGELFFTALQSPSFRTGTGTELYKTDGTAAGTVLIRDIHVGYEGSRPLELVAAFRGRIVFSADDGVHGREIWASDGTGPGTLMLQDIYPGRPGETQSAAPKEVFDAFGWTLFQADDGRLGSELWITDGSTSGTKLLKDIHPGVPGSDPTDFVRFGNHVYFAADDGSHGRELWRTDGTTTGTVLVSDLRPGLSSSAPHRLVALDDRIVFAAFGDEVYNEIFVSDGTSRGTGLLKDIRTGRLASSSPSGLTRMGRYVFFSATGDLGRELWRTDGTPAGTVLVKDIRPGSGWSQPRFLTVHRGTLYFSANDGLSPGTAGFELWRSDGTEQGTVMVRDIWPSFGSSDPREITALGDVIVFSAQELGTPTSPGREVWVSDGTAAGTMLLKDIQPGRAHSNPRGFTRAGTRVFFSADDGTHGAELWTTDGTPAGTTLVRDLYVGASSSDPTHLLGVGNHVWFRASDLGPTGKGTELWKSDGTAAGTEVIDLRPGPASSNPRDLTLTLGRLVFAAEHAEKGEELWLVEKPGASVDSLPVACGPTAASIEASTPILGSRTRVEGFGAPAATVGVHVLGAPSSWSPPGLRCSLHVDLLQLLALQPFAVQGPQFGYDLPLPSDVDLEGSVLAIQTLYVDPVRPAELQASNTLWLTLGIR